MSIKDLPIIWAPAQVGLVATNTELGEIIRRVTQSPWSHAFLIDPRTDPPTTVEAHDLDGVRSCLLSSYFNNPAYGRVGIFDYPGITDEQRDRIMEEAHREVGEPYDTPELIGIYVHHLLPELERAKNPLAQPGKVICSGLVGKDYKAAGLNVYPPGVGEGYLTPGDLALTLRLLWQGIGVPGKGVVI